MSTSSQPPDEPASADLVPTQTFDLEAGPTTFAQVQSHSLSAEDMARLNNPKARAVLASYLQRFASENSRAVMERVGRVVGRDLFQVEDPGPQSWAVLATQAAPGILARYRAELERQVIERSKVPSSGMAASTAAQRLAFLRGIVRRLAFDDVIPAGELHRLIETKDGALAPITVQTRQRQPTVPEGAIVDMDAALRARSRKQEGVQPTPNGASRDRAILALFSLGLRRFEVAEARWEHLEDRGESQGGLVLVVAGKGRKKEPQPVPVPKGSEEVLEEWRDRCGSPTAGPILRAMSRRGDLVLPDVDDDGTERYLTPRAVARRVQRLLEEAGIEGTGTHAFRRAFVTSLIDAGLELPSVQRLARHSDPATTMRYDRRAEAKVLKEGRQAGSDPFRASA